jgi:hypothetical protein
MTKLVVAYCRTACTVAHDPLSGVRLQEEELRHYAKSKGLAIRVSYAEAGVSGITLERPELQRLLADCRAGLIDTVITKDHDRLSRDNGQLLLLLQFFRKAGVRVEFSERAPNERFIETVLSAIAEYEKAKRRSGSSRAHDIENAASYSVIDASGPRMLVIRGADDEASLTLAAGSIGSRLSSLFFFIVIPGLVVFGLFPVVGLINWAGLLSKERIELLVLVIGHGSCFALLALLFLPGICKSAFGREFLTTAFVCEIATDSTPDTRARVDAITLSPVETAAGLRLRHFIYEHPKCVNEIVRWIREVL